MNIDPMGVDGQGLSTTAHAWKTLIPRNALVAHTMGDSPPAQFDQTYSGGGDEKYFLPRRFEGVVAATPWGNRRGLYRCQRLEDARTVTVAAEAAAAVEAAVTGQKQ
jgi:hypothetical protein